MKEGKNHYRITDFAESERPRERLARLGPKALSNAELLAILLRPGLDPARGGLISLAASLAVVRAAGSQGSRITMEAPSGSASGWQAREATDGLPFSSQSDLDEGMADGTAWVPSFLAWSRASKNSWMWALVPYLLVLSSIRLSSRRSLGGQTYTLY